MENAELGLHVNILACRGALGVDKGRLQIPDEGLAVIEDLVGVCGVDGHGQVHRKVERRRVDGCGDGLVMDFVELGRFPFSLLAVFQIAPDVDAGRYLEEIGNIVFVMATFEQYWEIVDEVTTTSKEQKIYDSIDAKLEDYWTTEQKAIDTGKTTDPGQSAKA